jgi:hypothetical protein
MDLKFQTLTYFPFKRTDPTPQIENMTPGHPSSIMSRVKKLSNNIQDIPSAVVKIETKNKKYFIRKENEMILTIITDK